MQRQRPSPNSKPCHYVSNMQYESWLWEIDYVAGCEGETRHAMNEFELGKVCLTCNAPYEDAHPQFGPG